MAQGVNVRVSGRLKKFVDQKSGPNGLYESASEYVRDLIRRDYEQSEEEKWAWLRKELEPGMAAADEDFVESDVEELIAEAKREKASGGL